MLALPLLLRAAVAAWRLSSDREILQERSERRGPAQPKWLTSLPFLLFLVLVWVDLGAGTAIAGHDWYKDERSATHQKELLLDLTSPMFLWKESIPWLPSFK